MASVWQRLSEIVGSASERTGVVGSLVTLIDPDTWLPGGKDAAFTLALIALSAKMAVSDGVVTASELRAFHRTVDIPPGIEEQVDRVFRLAQQDVAGYETYADEIARLLKDNKKLLQDVLEGLMYVAAVDGALHPDEDAFLAEVARRFGFSPSEFQFFRARFVVDHGNPYDALRLTPQATDEEIKRQYRKLVADNHPDKLMGRGVPAEFVEIATRKLAAINAAYDTIAKERGL